MKIGVIGYGMMARMLMDSMQKVDGYELWAIAGLPRGEEKLKKFNGNQCTEKHVYNDIVRPGKKRVLIIKQVAGQGAMYDTHMFPKDPSSSIGTKSIIDMGNMPVIITPNEYRDGIIRSMH